MKRSNMWTTQGFDGFSQGTFGNAGHNLYVSRAGVLQRIHQYDLDKDGYVDLVFCNDHNNGDKPPVYVYGDPLGSVTRTELPSDGPRSGAVVADLNGDGYDDLVLGMLTNGQRSDLNAFVYYGSPDGLSERRQQLLPAPVCTSVAAGDFNGDGRPDLAFRCQIEYRSPDPYVRIFYQSELGFEPNRYVDLEISGDQLEAYDLDGDGYADLVVRSSVGEVRVYWGGPQGIDPAQVSLVPVSGAPTPSGGKQEFQDQAGEYFDDAPPLARVIALGGEPHVFVPGSQSALLVPVYKNRQFGPPIVLDCGRAMAVAVGDVNGDGSEDLILATREPYEEGECSWIYWGSQGGYDETRRTRLRTMRACDVAVGDLDGDGCDDIVFSQMRTEESYTTDSYVYRGARDGVIAEPVRLQSEDARRVLIARPSADKRPQVLFVNTRSRDALGNIKSTIYFGGPEGFSPEHRKDVPSFRAVDAVCCDINDDGYADIVLANCFSNTDNRKGGSYVLFNGPDGFPDEPSIILPTNQADGVCCADLNRDGYLDLIFVSYEVPDILILYGGPDGFDTSSPRRIRMERDGVLYDDPRYIYLADLNNDGWLDLVVPQIFSDRSFILWGGPDGFSMERCQMLSVARGCCARAADLTGNGYLDLIMGGFEPSLQGPHDSFAYIYWNGPDGLREDRRTLLPGKAITSMSVADFNNDGLLDLFIASYHDGRERDIDSYIYWNREGRGFSATDRTRLFTHSASGCMAADFNEDGWTDLAIGYHRVDGEHQAYSAVWWNGPDGFDEKRVTELPTEGPHAITSVGPGNIMDRGPEEYYTSTPFELPEGTEVTRLSWQAETPPKAWVRAQLRSADTREGLDGLPWVGPGAGRDWFEAGQEVQLQQHMGKWVQYRLALGAVNSGSTPRVTRVDVHYGTRE